MSQANGDILFCALDSFNDVNDDRYNYPDVADDTEEDPYFAEDAQSRGRFLSDVARYASLCVMQSSGTRATT